MNLARTVAIACESAEGLAGQVSGHFGRTPYFVVAELDGHDVASSKLVAAPAHGSGCGMPAFVQSLGATAIIVGGIGAGALGGCAARGIEIVAGATGNAGTALAAFAKGELAPGEPACHGHGAHDHGCHHQHN